MSTSEQMSRSREVATLGGGCFWCTEAVFSEVKGVEKVESGYAGGTLPNPSYEQVCDGDTGHAEVVNVTFDPNVITYRELLGIFFTVHDPTTLNRQGADVGSQYRSAIFYRNEEQKRIAEEAIREVDDSGIWGQPAVTELAPFEVFYKAEEYHQEYFLRNPSRGYCTIVIAPKVLKFRKKYASLLKSRAG